MSKRIDQPWRRQLALFAAGASAFIGLGFVLLAFVVWREKKENLPPTKPAPSHLIENPKPGNPG